MVAGRADGGAAGCPGDAGGERLLPAVWRSPGEGCTEGCSVLRSLRESSAPHSSPGGEGVTVPSVWI